MYLLNDFWDRKSEGAETQALAKSFFILYSLSFSMVLFANSQVMAIFPLCLHSQVMALSHPSLQFHAPIQSPLTD